MSRQRFYITFDAITDQLEAGLPDKVSKQMSRQRFYITFDAIPDQLEAGLPGKVVEERLFGTIVRRHGGGQLRRSLHRRQDILTQNINYSCATLKIQLVLRLLLYCTSRNKSYRYEFIDI